MPCLLFAPYLTPLDRPTAHHEQRSKRADRGAHACYRSPDVQAMALREHIQAPAGILRRSRHTFEPRPLHLHHRYLASMRRRYLFRHTLVHQSPIGGFLAEVYIHLVEVLRTKRFHHLELPGVATNRPCLARRGVATSSRYRNNRGHQINTTLVSQSQEGPAGLCVGRFGSPIRDAGERPPWLYATSKSLCLVLSTCLAWEYFALFV